MADQSDEGTCGGAASKIGELEAKVAALPEGIDPDVESALDDGLDRLRELVDDECPDNRDEPADTTPTETTPTETEPTETQPTETEPTETEPTETQPTEPEPSPLPEPEPAPDEDDDGGGQTAPEVVP